MSKTDELRNEIDVMLNNIANHIDRIDRALLRAINEPEGVEEPPKGVYVQPGDMVKWGNDTMIVMRDQNGVPKGLLRVFGEHGGVVVCSRWPLACELTFNGKTVLGVKE